MRSLYPMYWFLPDRCPWKTFLSLSYAASAPRACKANIWVSIRLLPMTSPPGGDKLKSPNLTVIGPANKIEALICFNNSGLRWVGLILLAWTRHVVTSRISILVPKLSNNDFIVHTSWISGIFLIRQAAISALRDVWHGCLKRKATSQLKVRQLTKKP